MLFPTVTFAVFFLLALPLSWLLMPRQPIWRVFMLAASYVFYGWWSWRYVALLAGLTIFAWLVAGAIHRAARAGTRKLGLAAGVLGAVGTLGYFKYQDFFVSSAFDTLEAVGIELSPYAVSVVLPVGISFYTFMALAYMIDVYRRDFEPVSLPKFAVYLAFFPHLVAGPIVRPSELLPQMDSPRDPERVDTSRGFLLIASGAFMKVVIASHLATEIVDPVFGAPSQRSSLEVLVGMYGYSVQIYADFFGYTAMAIGIALLLGFRFPDNFNNPYTAVSIQDFWHRWHITLSRWFRDYVYIPLGGNRGARGLVYRNLMVTMLVAGLWHGAGWTFVVWGGIHGSFLVLERWRRDRRRRLGLGEPADTRASRYVRRFAVFNIVTLAWVFFRADSFGSAADVLERLFTAWGQASPALTLGVLAAIGVGIGSQYVPTGWYESLMALFARRRLAAKGAFLGATVLLISSLGPEGVAPFIYFQF